MTDPDITLDKGAHKGRYIFRKDGAEAELTFSVVSPTQIIADHTEVPDAIRGTGAGRRLVERLAADARAGGFTVIALCPYVRAQAQRHPDWSDAFV
jgi:predicted GNAT family acetyltransferase